ncbi:MAG TPA: hypothetical protein PKX55_03000, partial [Leptospiraceae bacterium]|nr:hypothetical protein [Leptospiraceae bacterium]
KRYADGTKKLKEGDTIYAYLSGKGYIARGDVKEKAKLVRDFFSGKDKNKIISKSFLEHLNDKSFEGFHNADIGEYAVKVEWNFKNPPVTNSDLHISPMTICKMNQANLAILEREFQTKKGEIKK